MKKTNDKNLSALVMKGKERGYPDDTVDVTQRPIMVAMTVPEVPVRECSRRVKLSEKFRCPYLNALHLGKRGGSTFTAQ